jgi:23S rRNA (uracil1939-C5)-methyltransferase
VVTEPADPPAGAAPVPLELTARVAAGGDVIGHLSDGRIVFVEGALPGEVVTAMVTETRRDFARARVVEVRVASPDRVTAPCPHRRRGCGGCPWQEIAPAAQVGLKEQILADALLRIGRIEAPVLAETIRLPATQYRTTVHLAVTADGRSAFRRRHEVAPLAIDSCLVAHPWIDGILGELLLPGQRVATVRVGVAGGERLVVLDRRASRRPSVPAGVEIVGPGRDAYVHEEVGGRRWRVSARVFFQPGPAAAEALAGAVDAAVGDALGPGGLLVDAYAGVGVLGGIVAARRGARLLAVESHPAAARNAAHNLADLDATVVTAEVGAWPPVKADVVIADPARSGLGRPGVGVLAACGAARLVLVSCDPASLGRDVALLSSAGYRLVETRAVDSFAQTVHVEAVSVFDRVPDTVGVVSPPPALL